MHVNSANDDGDPEDARRQRQGTRLAAQSRVAARQHGSSGGGNVKYSFFSDSHQQCFLRRMLIIFFNVNYDQNVVVKSFIH